MINRRSFLAVGALVALCFASAQPSRAADEAALKVGEFSFKPVDKWKAKEVPGMMSAGGFTVLSSDGTKTISADFYHFGAGGGGGTDANIARWKGQFQPGADGAEVKFERKELNFGKRKAILIFIKGTFLGGSMVGPKTATPGSAMIGAILESEEGNVFVKFTGAEKDIDANRDSFIKLIGTAYPDAPTEAKAADASK